ncbi:MAG: response regulator transcription factor [Myxococcota bacterium]
MASASGTGDKQPRILVVEDDEAVRKMVARMLSALGDVRTAGDGTEALHLIRSGAAPDVVVTDVMMPGLDGFSLAKRLKTDPATRRIPVVILTAKDRPQDMVDGINAGARHYVTKPFKREELVAKVKRALGIR